MFRCIEDTALYLLRNPYIRKNNQILKPIASLTDINESKNIALLVLAAGASLRLGKPKQQVEIEGETMLSRTLRIGSQIDWHSKHLVVGYRKEEILKNQNLHQFEVIDNVNWSMGLGKSIATGVRVIQNENIKGVMLCLVDQFFLNQGVFEKILSTISSEDNIVRCRYLQGAGPPVFFGKNYFSELVKLNDDHGAKSIIELYNKRVKEVPFDKGHIDLDTQEDLKWIM